MKKDLFNLILRNSKKNPNKTVYICGDEKITYSQLVLNIKIISENLKKFNLNKKDKVGIISQNSILFPQILFVASYLDLTIVPINPQLSKSDLINQLNNLEIKILFSWNEFLNGLDFKKNFN